MDNTNEQIQENKEKGEKYLKENLNEYNQIKKKFLKTVIYTRNLQHL